MSRHPLRSAVRLGVALAIAASVVGVAHAASLGGVSADTLAAWSYPADIVVEDPTPPTIPAAVAPVATAFGSHNASTTVKTASMSVPLNIDLTGPVVEIVGVDDGDVVDTPPTVTCTATVPNRKGKCR